MFFKAIAVLALPLLAVANPISASSQCSTGSVNCCNDGACSEGFLTVLGSILKSSCQTNEQTVCCENNQFNGLINIGCTPIYLGL